MASAADIRQQFIDYFKEKADHTYVPSSPVVPHDDPTLLFTNAGMNQFKDVFLGVGERPYSRAANTQKCIRAGGKHNDLDDVGRDTYHHTFFEMLGNWSFGDYFKVEAIDWAWDLLVNVWGLDPERLHATYFEGDASENLEPDLEAKALWEKYLPADRIHPGNKKDNFWEMGDTGPCGPCSEIHYDRTPDRSGGSLVNGDSPDVIEIWNLVFIQFNRDQNNKLTPLPAKHVDTGMGFERICAVIQGKASNYDTDVFAPLFASIQKVTNARAYRGGGDQTTLTDPIDIAYRVIADHIRTLTFAITDGALPSNEGRGYVLRRILRRAVKYGHIDLGVKEPFFYKLVDDVVTTFGEAFPELKKTPDQVKAVIREEEESFGRTLDRGIELFHVAVARSLLISKLKHPWTKVRFVSKSDEDSLSSINNRLGFYSGSTGDSGSFDPQLFQSLDKKLISERFEEVEPISSESAFELYATYGFPLDLTQLMAAERGMTVDVTGFEKLMEEHRQASKGEKNSNDPTATLADIVRESNLPKTQFLGYDHLLIDGANLIARYAPGNGQYREVDHLDVGERGAVVLNQTTFYGESGGQVGDTGYIRSHSGAVFRVDDTQRFGEVFFHLGELESAGIHKSEKSLPLNQPLLLEVTRDRRDAIARHHTTTHLMNHALRDVLGDHVQQRGSLVDEEKTRFDFSHGQALTIEQIEAIEEQVNAAIKSDLQVYWEIAGQTEAMEINSLRAVFGEKYPPRVRVVSIGVPVGDLLEHPKNEKWMDYSIEFCGGTHLSRTSHAERFVIVSEESVSKGVRRIIAVAGHVADQVELEAATLEKEVESLHELEPSRLADAVASFTERINNAVLPLRTRARLRNDVTELQKSLKEYQKQQERQGEAAVADTAKAIAEQETGTVIVAEVPGADGKSLRTAMDIIRKKHPEAALLLGSASEGKCAFIASVPESLIQQGLKAGDWVREVAQVTGGGGGGRPDMAQAGGKDPEKLTAALNAGRDYAEQKV